jgi:hypothetical protein
MDISLTLAKLAKQKGFKPITIKFYSDKKNGSRNSAEPKSFNTLKADERYGEMYACTDIEVLKKWFKIKGDSEEEVIEALVLVGVAPVKEVVIEPSIEPEVEEVPDIEEKEEPAK